VKALLLFEGLRQCRMFGNLPGLPTPTAFFTVSRDGVKSPSYPVDVLCPQVMHDFLITENYAVFFDQAQVRSLHVPAHYSFIC
jgi:carotenoid cleavage dioxygenase-like enzyme